MFLMYTVIAVCNSLMSFPYVHLLRIRKMKRLLKLFNQNLLSFLYVEE